MTAVMQGVREGAQQKLQHTSAQTQAALHILAMPCRAGYSAGTACRSIEAGSGGSGRPGGRNFPMKNSPGRAPNWKALKSFIPGYRAESSASTAKKPCRKPCTICSPTRSATGPLSGSQLRDTLAAYQPPDDFGRSHPGLRGVQLTHAITDLMRQIAAGLLTGIAERVKPDDKAKENILFILMLGQHLGEAMSIP